LSFEKNLQKLIEMCPPKILKEMLSQCELWKLV
jgi:hypothetical protein